MFCRIELMHGKWLNYIRERFCLEDGAYVIIIDVYNYISGRVALFNGLIICGFILCFDILISIVGCDKANAKTKYISKINATIEVNKSLVVIDN